MPAAASPNARGDSAAPDDLDNLLDYDGAVQDFWKDLPDVNGGNANNVGTAPAKDIDEEVKVTKKRKPNPKLDDTRLLSDAGIPKLRRITKDRLKFKGKGHEFADISRMLNIYQLWLDDLYPKAKFRDALTMVEKLGHSKRMQVSRRAWIDESKVMQRRENEEGELPDVGAEGRQNSDGDAIFSPETGSRRQEQRKQGTATNQTEGDDLDELFAEEAAAETARPQNSLPSSRGPFQDDDDEPDEDELDALLSENRTSTQQPQNWKDTQRGPFEEEEPDEQDGLDALLAEEPQKSRATAAANTGSSKPQVAAEDTDFADDEEAMRDMGW